MFPPPPNTLIDTQGGQRFLVEQLLNQRDVKGRQTTYLVLWRGYSPSADSWEICSQLMMGVLGLVEQYDKAHPMPKKIHHRTNAQRVFRVITN